MLVILDIYCLTFGFCPVLSPPIKTIIALHLSFDIASYICSRMFAWLSQAQEEIGLRHISSGGTSGRDKYSMYETVYSGNKTHNTGMDQAVPWCNLWIVPIKCTHCQNESPCNCSRPCKPSKQKEGLLTTSVHLPSTCFAGSLQGLPLVSTLFPSELLHTMQSQRRCNLISKLAQSGEINMMLIHFVITKNRGLMKFNQ